MKKLALSLFIVGLFVFYSSHKPGGNALLASSALPTSPPPDNSPTPIPTAIPTANPQNAGPAVQATPTDTPSTNQGGGNGMMNQNQMGGGMMGQYKDGSYTGDSVDVFYGNVQVQAIVQGGKITDVKFLQYPSDRQTSVEINSQAMPILTSQAIQAQSANVDGVSGASATSQGFVTSLSSALAKAK